LTRICDYEGSRYRTEFWNRDRLYEDLAERIAMQHMLPPAGKTILEVGAGFGRMVDMYSQYDTVVLVDYARTQLDEARRYLGHDSRFVFVVADVYRLPFLPNLFDALVMIRVMHHLVDIPAALRQLHAALRPQGTAVIEFASKHNIKAIARWLLRRQRWNPFSLEPYEFVELNIDFHPAWMKQRFAEAGLDVRAVRTVSHFRLPLLKKLFSPQVLARLDGLAQSTGRWWQLTPSVFLQSVANKMPAPEPDGLFMCPACGGTQFDETTEAMHCLSCHRKWPIEDGIYNFKEPLPAEN